MATNKSYPLWIVKGSVSTRDLTFKTKGDALDAYGMYETAASIVDSSKSHNDPNPNYLPEQTINGLPAKAVHEELTTTRRLVADQLNAISQLEPEPEPAKPDTKPERNPAWFAEQKKKPEWFKERKKK